MIRFLYTLITALAFTYLPANEARAENCAQDLSDHLLPADRADHLIITADRDCNRVWEGTLRQSGVAAEIMAETGLSNTDALVAQVRQGLIIADQALTHLGPDVKIVTPARGAVGSIVWTNSQHKVTVILATTNLIDTRDNPNGSKADAYAELLEGDCYLVILPNSQRVMGRPGAMSFIMAHELFHCVQAATLSNYDNSAEGVNAKWWVESSAHWFAHRALPKQVVETYTQSVNKFEDESADLPFREFPYALWPFFAWVAQDAGSSQAVMDILARMPEGEHDDEQVASILGAAGWNEFAKKYSAYQIQVSEAVAVNPKPRVDMEETEIELMDVGDAQDYSFARRTAALDRYKITLSPGDYKLSTTASDSMFLSEFGEGDDPDGNWIEISQPAGSLSLNVPCGEDKSYALVGISTESPAAEFTLSVKLVDETCICGEVPVERDMCVIGIWEDQGPIEQYLSETPTTSDATIAPVDTFYSDGSYTQDIPFNLVSEVGDATITTAFDVAQTIGSWGTSGNKLTICETRQINKGTVHTVSPNTDLTLPVDTDETLDPERYTKYTYTCNESTLTMKKRKILFLSNGLNLTFKRR